MIYVSLPGFQHPTLIDYPPADHCMPGVLTSQKRHGLRSNSRHPLLRPEWVGGMFVRSTT
jgi:hypothetical protein